MTRLRGYLPVALAAALLAGVPAAMSALTFVVH
jgi:hypothetical protein